ncbi:MAG: hypothetical protein JKP97_21055 [Rhodobacteraceae bacterium]|jgi:hypothetical protein|nr:hypothetical protein [Paracoccaceae bacterium]
MQEFDDSMLDPPDDEQDEAAVKPVQSLDPDAILDTLVPATVDWRGTVSRHPLLSVASVGLVGYMVGRTRGASILTGLTAALSAAMMRQLSDVFEGDFFDL